MASALQIRAQIAGFLVNEQSLSSLVDWLTRNIWVANTKEMESRRLAGDVELIVAEYSAHHIDEQHLRRQLLDLLRTNVVVGGPPVTVTSTTSHTPLIVFAVGSPAPPSFPAL